MQTAAQSEMDGIFFNMGQDNKATHNGNILVTVRTRESCNFVRA